MKYDRKRMRRELLKRQEESLLESLEYCIKRQTRYFDRDTPFAITALIDKIVLSGNWKTESRDWQMIKSLYQLLHRDKSHVPAERMPNYRVKLIKELPDCTVIIFTDAMNSCSPFRMEMHHREGATIQQRKARIVEISHLLPDLKVSQVEYTLDIFCRDAVGVRRLFRALRKYSYFPYQRTPVMLGGGVQCWGEKIKMNAVFRAGDAKFYERGPDHKKIGPHWNLEDTDRVRLEHAATRETLKKYGISTLSDFVGRPHFHLINKDIFQFKCFVGSKKLPHYGELYAATDQAGHGNCFMLELKCRRHMVKNIHQYVKDFPFLDRLKSELVLAMNGFDSQWKELI